jgi:hypothetical protein
MATEYPMKVAVQKLGSGQAVLVQIVGLIGTGAGESFGGQICLVDRVLDRVGIRLACGMVL